MLYLDLIFYLFRAYRFKILCQDSTKFILKYIFKYWRKKKISSDRRLTKQRRGAWNVKRNVTADRMLAGRRTAGEMRGTK